MITQVLLLYSDRLGEGQDGSQLSFNERFIYDRDYQYIKMFD